MLFFRHINICDTLIKFEATENDAVYGFCMLDLSGKNAIVTEIDFPEDKPFIAEGLLKAAFNFAAAQNFYMGGCKCGNISPLLISLGFANVEDLYILDIPSILMGSCCKK